MGNYLYWLPGMIVVALLSLLMSRKLLHYFQLESYQFHGYFHTILRQYKKTILPFMLFGLLIWFPGYSLAPEWFNSDAPIVWWRYVLIISGVVIVPMLVFSVIYYTLAKRSHEKKKFVVTARVKRLMCVYALVLLLIQSVILLLPGHYAYGFYGAFVALMPLWLALAALLDLPIERLIFHMYFDDARKKLLQNPSLIRIGITGSYGKTSTKFILAQILRQKYNVLCTPSSFNTPMGVTRIVRERLEPSHQVFIGEMGARHVGEIKELSRLVTPSIGILTSVGPQHLDTFRTIERIRDTKYELIQALPKDGYAVFSDDGDIVRGLYEKTSLNKALVGTEGSDAWAQDVHVTSSGSSFTLHVKGLQPFSCQTILLGEHNIRNILVAAQIAAYLGLTARQIARGISNLKPIEHRLQLLPNPGGYTVIDDAFNTNPRSSKEAMKVLAAFDGRKILVTPGMVELGDKEDEYNYEFGKAIATAADIVYLVGKKHTAPIKKGILDAGRKEADIHVVSSLDEAISQLNALMRPGDVIMYENDLPDNYSE